jgi:hypothetical protein
VVAGFADPEPAPAQKKAAQDTAGDE